MDQQTHENPWFAHFEHPHTDNGVRTDCPYSCPVCMGMAMVRQMKPEVAAHLAAAGREFFLAAKAFLDGMAEAPDQAAKEPKVEHIDLED